MTTTATYWTDDLRGLTVFDIVKESVKENPNLIAQLRTLLNELSEVLENETN